ncbi:MAG TPA: tripartite tricarboxylate transporter substrate binding protein [Pseudolabrys sp.]|jgi:tripartite-type tricarboxylate transporter receptor subunit TctC|nr:tripartite tricarboxylate transporter substrate binding protein [Pseudolabrys sp.]
MRRFILALALLAIGAGAAAADDYPSHPIRLIVPFAPGGALDTVARVLAPSLSANLGQPVVVYNQGGAGGVIGMEAAAKAAPDGYTLLLDHSGLAYMPGLHRTLPFDPVTSFEGVVTAVSGIYVLAVNPSLPVKSVAELIKYAKAHPGKLSYGSAGVGSSLHLAGEFFKREAGIDIVHVPYKGASHAVTDLVGGQVQMMFGPATAILPLAKAGKLRALAVTSAKPSKLAPDLPTVAQTLPGFEVVGWYGLAAPAGTPKDVVRKLNADANKALKTPELIEKFAKLGYEPIGDTPAEASARIKSEVAHWTRIIRAAGIKAQ